MVNIAVVGFGVVGTGVCEVFYKNKKSLEAKVGQELDIKYIVDISTFPDSPFSNKIISDFSVVEADSSVKVVAECIGGKTVAYDFVKRALIAGKSVVTSNKELVAYYGSELLKLAVEKGVSFLFEASVGGGIPIIRPLHTSFQIGDITSVVGILNGTTNYILTKMQSERLSFEVALKQAQDLGYAESNPRDDIEGFDSCRKICILAALAFGHAPNPDEVVVKGITKITSEMMDIAKNGGFAIKLLGIAEKNGEKVRIGVSPLLVPLDSQLATVSDVFNAILVNSKSVGNVVFYGRGAGKLPTAHAMVNDIVVASRAEKTELPIIWEKGKKEDFDYGYSGVGSGRLKVFC